VLSVEAALQRVLNAPTPDAIWHLHPHLLALDVPGAEAARELARSLYCYLSNVQSKLSSKQHSSLSALLAAGSIGIIAIQDVREALACNPDQVWSNLLAGGLAGTLELLSTFQHVKSWETEFVSAHEGAVWDLYAALWQLSSEMKPDLPFEQRQALIDPLLSIVRDPGTPSAVRVALIVRLFQILLVIRLVPLLVLPVQDASGAD
jgi:hypothetical protein